MNAKTKRHFWNHSTAHRAGRLFSASDTSKISYSLDHDSRSMPIYRQAAFRFSSVAMTALILVSAISYAIAHQYQLALAIAATFPVMIWHCWRMFRYSKALVPAELLMAVTVATLMLTIYYEQYANIYWAPALVVLFHFILTRKLAILFNLLLYGLLAPVIIETLPSQPAMIMLLSMALMSVGAYIFSMVVYRQDQLLQKVAVQDPLTLAYNRRYLMECLEQTFELNKRYKKVSSLIMLDIDHFKSINDAFGHGEGDRALKEVVRILQHRLRRTDSLFRYGGEEFVILLNETDSSHGYQLALEFCGLIKKARIMPERVITVSCGVAELSGGENPLGWLARCDEALYRAKHGGRDRAELA